jgi:nitrite reductase (NADH) small subunit
MSVALHLEPQADPVQAPVQAPAEAPADAPTPELDWLDACGLAEIPVGCGVAALLRGRQIALVRPGDDEVVFALSNYDPFSEAFVIARGIVGDAAGRLKIASPIYKQSFDLETGACLDDEVVRLPVYPVRVRAGRVEVGLQP